MQHKPTLNYLSELLDVRWGGDTWQRSYGMPWKYNGEALSTTDAVSMGAKDLLLRNYGGNGGKAGGGGDSKWGSVYNTLGNVTSSAQIIYGSVGETASNGDGGRGGLGGVYHNSGLKAVRYGKSDLDYPGAQGYPRGADGLAYAKGTTKSKSAWWVITYQNGYRDWSEEQLKSCFTTRGAGTLKNMLAS